MPTPDSKNQLIIFGRYPRVGQVKTRLIPILGPAGAAALQKRLAERTMAAARRLADRTAVWVVFCYDGGSRQRIERWLGLKDIGYQPQAAGGLGRRMRHAMQTAFRRGARRVVLVGTDIPDLTDAILSQAFDRLKACDLVLGPSTDGGYWLVGLTRPIDIFDSIPWSTSAVLEKTLALARRAGLQTELLDPLTDLDTPDDLIGKRRAPLWTGPYLSVIIPTFNNARHIAATISASASPDTEIVVSDGGSRDDTLEIAKAHGARTVVGTQLRADRLNRGAAATRGAVLLFVPADTRLPNHFEHTIFETLMDRQQIIGAFQFQTTPTLRWITCWTHWRTKMFKLPCSDHVLFMRRGDFTKASGFPELPIAENLYLVRRMAQPGSFTVVPRATTASAERLRRRGLLRTMLVDTLLAAGCRAGMSPGRLATVAALIDQSIRS
ncbi:MAG: TIGR04282 family arsenosugar biosynthesis glycosyltransferase [Desulfosarcina sp.]